MAADFSLLQPAPNFGQALLSGYQAGAALGKQKQLDAALQGADLTKPETLLPVFRADPEHGAALLSASVSYAKAHSDAAATTALGNAFASMYGGGGGGQTDPATVAEPAGTAAAATSLANTAAQASPATGQPGQVAPDGSIVVSAAHPVTQMPPTMQQAVGTLLSKGVSLDDATKFVALGNTMTEAQQKQTTARYGALDAVIEAGKDANGNWKSPAELKALAQANRSNLIAQGVPASEIDSFDGSPEMAQQIENQAVGAKDALAILDKNRSFNLDQAKFGETQRHDRADEGNAAANTGLHAQEVSISGAHLAIDKAHLAIEQKKASAAVNGTGGIATPTSKAEYNALPAGSRYYKNGQVFVKSGANG